LIRPNDFVLQIATVNGSGSQTANQILVKALFRMGIPVSGKNLFPSNIQGLATWFTVRANPEGFLARRPSQDLVVALNQATAVADQKHLKPEGLLLYSTDFKLPANPWRSDIRAVAVPFRELASQASDSVKVRKLLTNLLYVGILAEILKIDQVALESSIDDLLHGKSELIVANKKTLAIGRRWAIENESSLKSDIQAATVPQGNAEQILIDGNSAAALGLLYGGCTFASWYPITPSSSVMEKFTEYAKLWRRDGNGHNRFAIVQAEDELAAIGMVIGAGWAGARAVTATSGPGLSLMAETAGLAYFAEIPSVIWNVQRAGPSTGLPTRTMQADVRAASHLSHGDTRQVLLFPGNPEECFTFAQTAMDLAEELQTLVIVLSDLDIGMNLHRTKKWKAPKTPWSRGKVLSNKDLEQISGFARYRDADGDGVGPRTLPGTDHPHAAYFTRGTSHDEEARYSEDPDVFRSNLERLKRKWETARWKVPAPEWSGPESASVAFVYFGSSDGAVQELRATLAGNRIETTSVRLRAYPFTEDLGRRLEKFKKIFVVEQNRDGQMRDLLAQDFPEIATRLKSVLSYDGWPLAAENLQAELARSGETLKWT
jgi:2-oxoglutarate/2-oxoacid ferredoxin oxidoreductase subunit alpha